MGRGERYIIEVEEGKARKGEERGGSEKGMKGRLGEGKGRKETL